MEFEMDKMSYIEMLSRKNNFINMSNNNSKTGMACLNLAMPAPLTCREDAPCKKGCYACKGRQTMCSVQASYMKNYRLYNEDAKAFFEQVYYKIKFGGLPLVRLFDAGDFPDMQFLEMLVDVCKRLPKTKFMAFTKKYDIVNTYLKSNNLPDNLNIVFSAWDKEWLVENPFSLPVAYVEFKDSTKNPEIPATAFSCPGRLSTCSACRICWSKKVKAVKFHQH